MHQQYALYSMSGLKCSNRADCEDNKSFYEVIKWIKTQHANQ